MSVSVISIVGRADRGLSRAFLCEGDDGNLYFVKKDNIAADQLVIEYLIGRLAEECGLPVAPIQILTIPPELVDYAPVEKDDGFRAGPAFGSQQIPFADEVRSTHLRQIEEGTKARCLCFDWWVRNPDRCLGAVGGDPNILWDPASQRIHLIDHDRCLDPDFDEVEFKREHVFRDVRPFIDSGFYEKWRIRFESAIYHLDAIWQEMPQAWFVDEHGVTRSALTRPEVEASLMKPPFDHEDILPG